MARYAVEIRELEAGVGSQLEVLTLRNAKLTVKNMNALTLKLTIMAKMEEIEDLQEYMTASVLSREIHAITGDTAGVFHDGLYRPQRPWLCPAST